MTEKVHCNVCIRDTYMWPDMKIGYWICMCCGRRLWKVGGLFPA